MTNPLVVIFIFVFGVAVSGFATWRGVMWVLKHARIITAEACDEHAGEAHLHVALHFVFWSTETSPQWLPVRVDERFYRAYREFRTSPHPKELEPEQ